MPTDPIIKRYPELFDLTSAPWQSSMHFGLQFEDSRMRDIIEGLCERLRPLALAAQDQGLNFKILAVKEKFGTLRIAFREGTADIETEVEAAKRAAILRKAACEDPAGPCGE